MIWTFGYLASVEDAVEAYLDVLTSGPGLAVLGLAALILLLTVIVDGLKWVWLTLLFWVGTFGLEGVIKTHRYLLPGLEQIQNFSRGIIIVLLLLLLVPILTGNRGSRMRVFSAGAIAFFIFEMLFSARYLMEPDTVDRGIFGGVVYVLIFLSLGVGLPLWLQTAHDRERLLHAILSSGILLVFGSLLQMIVSFSGAILAGRLQGTTANPQHMAAALGVVFPIALYVFTRRGERPFWRLASLFFITVGGIMLAWTGSRSGLLTALVGAILLFRGRMRLWVGTVLITGLLALVVIEVFDLHITGAAHMVETNNSRTEVWTRQYEAFLENPVEGVGEAGGGENSYLGSAARFGLMGVLPLLFTVFFTTMELRSANRALKHLGADSLFLARLLIGWFVAVAILCMFEEFLIGIGTEIVYFLYAMMALLPAARDLSPVQAGDPAPAPDVPPALANDPMEYSPI